MKVLISGLQGAGKGVYTVLRMIDVLQTTDMHMVTNFAIELNPWLRKMSRRRSRGEKGFLAHLRDTYGETYDAEKRIHIIPQSEVAQFYLWRVNHDGQLYMVTPIRNEKTGKVIAFDEGAFSQSLPVHYILDEAGQTFPARDWQSVSAGVGFYDAQHRKAGDNVDLTVQHPGQIDKQMRMLIQEYHSLVNHGYRRLGVFKQPNVISVIISNEPPESRSKTVGALPKVIRFDKIGIGGSFDTARGVGVQGMGADIERKRKGMPVWLLPLAVIAAGAGIIFAAKGAGWIAGRELSGGAFRQGERTKSALGVMVKTKVAAVQPMVVSARGLADGVKVTESRGSVDERMKLGIIGWVKFGKDEKILLNDGTTVVVPSARCMAADHDSGGALIDGRIITWERQKNENRNAEMARQRSVY